MCYSLLFLVYVVQECLRYDRDITFTYEGGEMMKGLGTLLARVKTNFNKTTKLYTYVWNAYYFYTHFRRTFRWKWNKKVNVSLVDEDGSVLSSKYYEDIQKSDLISIEKVTYKEGKQKIENKNHPA